MVAPYMADPLLGPRAYGMGVQTAPTPALAAGINGAVQGIQTGLSIYGSVMGMRDKYGPEAKAAKARAAERDQLNLNQERREDAWNGEHFDEVQGIKLDGMRRENDWQALHGEESRNLALQQQRLGVVRGTADAAEQGFKIGTLVRGEEQRADFFSRLNSVKQAQDVTNIVTHPFFSQWSRSLGSNADNAVADLYTRVGDPAAAQTWLQRAQQRPTSDPFIKANVEAAATENAKLQKESGELGASFSGSSNMNDLHAAGVTSATGDSGSITLNDAIGQGLRPLKVQDKGTGVQDPVTKQWGMGPGYVWGKVNESGGVDPMRKANGDYYHMDDDYGKRLSGFIGRKAWVDGVQRAASAPTLPQAGGAPSDNPLLPGPNGERPGAAYPSPQGGGMPGQQSVTEAAYAAVDSFMRSGDAGAVKGLTEKELAGATSMWRERNMPTVQQGNGATQAPPQASTQTTPSGGGEAQAKPPAIQPGSGTGGGVKAPEGTVIKITASPKLFDSIKAIPRGEGKGDILTEASVAIGSGKSIAPQIAELARFQAGMRGSATPEWNRDMDALMGQLRSADQMIRAGAGSTPGQPPQTPASAPKQGTPEGKPAEPGKIDAAKADKLEADANKVANDAANDPRGKTDNSEDFVNEINRKVQTLRYDAYVARHGKPPPPSMFPEAEQVAKKTTDLRAKYGY